MYKAAHKWTNLAGVKNPRNRILIRGNLKYLERLGCAASAAACAISKCYYPFILNKVCKSDVPRPQMYCLLIVAAPSASAAPLVVVCSMPWEYGLL